MEILWNKLVRARKSARAAKSLNPAAWFVNRPLIEPLLITGTIAIMLLVALAGALFRVLLLSMTGY